MTVAKPIPAYAATIADRSDARSFRGELKTFSIIEAIRIRILE
jgi:hypothetical protein